jgi:hypothetical protein
MTLTAGIESIHHMLRYIHLGREYRMLIFLVTLNCIMQLLCVGVVMGKSINLLTLISNFVGEQCHNHGIMYLHCIILRTKCCVCCLIYLTSNKYNCRGCCRAANR